jgi:AcrR family transcriptional regulator
MRVFWAQGYDGASLDDLTRAMGITRTSMYRAFGNKDDLFDQALRRYTDGPASYVADALQRATAQEVATAFLRGAVRATTLDDCPHGCLGVQASLATGASGRHARDALARWREEGVGYLCARFERAAAEGDLPDDVDADLLARYLMTVANGIAVQAAGGVPRDRLEQVAAAATRTWPPVAG